ncbi:hypothetical protein BD408DRAFT_341467 [Parasitella parasitica]|nr:hypothetical protein BD408DRAFT_341467 [Parasitella parasitica]
MCNISDPRILNAYVSIIEEEATDWLILGYRDTRDVISLYASGVHGLSEFRASLTNEILFGFVRIEDKFIQITYVPDSVSGVRRARALVHSRSVAAVLELSHAQFTASSLSDLSDSNVRTRLKLGQNQVPNRPRTALKRASFVVQQRRRRSGTYSPLTPSSPSPMSERNLKIHLTSSSYNPNPDFNYFAIAADNNTFNAVVDEQERKRLQDHTEAMLQFQLSKKKELEEARFRQFQRDQQEERFKREEEKKQSLIEQQKIVNPEKVEDKKASPLLQQDVAQQKDEKKTSPSQQDMPATQEDEKKEPISQQKMTSKHEKEATTSTAVLMTGFISAQTNVSPFWKRRYFEINSHSLLLYKDEMSKKAMSFVSLSTVERIAPSDEDDDTYVPNSYTIYTEQGNSYQLLADDKKFGNQIYATLKELISSD